MYAGRVASSYTAVGKGQVVPGSKWASPCTFVAVAGSRPSWLPWPHLSGFKCRETVAVGQLLPVWHFLAQVWWGQLWPLGLYSHL
jgi:hypothetical protein